MPQLTNEQYLQILGFLFDYLFENGTGMPRDTFERDCYLDDIEPPFSEDIPHLLELKNGDVELGFLSFHLLPKGQRYISTLNELMEWFRDLYHKSEQKIFSYEQFCGRFRHLSKIDRRVVLFFLGKFPLRSKYIQAWGWNETQGNFPSSSEVTVHPRILKFESVNKEMQDYFDGAIPNSPSEYFTWLGKKQKTGAYGVSPVELLAIPKSKPSSAASAARKYTKALQQQNLDWTERKINRKLSELDSVELCSVIKEDIRAAVMCLHDNLPKPSVIASGSAIEGMLGAKLKLEGIKDVERMTLVKMLDHAKKIGIHMEKIQLGDITRNWRNYVHPFKHAKGIAGGATITNDDATIAVRTVFKFLKTLDFKKEN